MPQKATKASARNTVFQFRHFAVNDAECAMKIGTDGVALGLFVGYRDTGALSRFWGLHREAFCVRQKGEPTTHPFNDNNDDDANMIQQVFEQAGLLHREEDGVHELNSEAIGGMQKTHSVQVSRFKKEANAPYVMSMLDVGVGSGIVSLVVAQSFVQWATRIQQGCAEEDMDREVVTTGNVGEKRKRDDEGKRDPLPPEFRLNITGLDVDPNACAAAEANFNAAAGLLFNEVSSTAENASGKDGTSIENAVQHVKLAEWASCIDFKAKLVQGRNDQKDDEETYDCVVSNPPFFKPLANWREKQEEKKRKKKKGTAEAQEEDHAPITPSKGRTAPETQQQQQNLRDAARLYDSLPPSELAETIFTKLRKPSVPASGVENNRASASASACPYEFPADCSLKTDSEGAFPAAGSAFVVYPCDIMDEFLAAIHELNYKSQAASRTRQMQERQEGQTNDGNRQSPLQQEWELFVCRDVAVFDHLPYTIDAETGEQVPEVPFVPAVRSMVQLRWRRPKTYSNSTHHFVHHNPEAMKIKKKESYRNSSKKHQTPQTGDADVDSPSGLTPLEQKLLAKSTMYVKNAASWVPWYLYEGKRDRQYTMSYRGIACEVYPYFK